MPGAIGADVGAARFPVHVGGDPLQDRAERLVGLRGSAGHDRRSLQGAYLSSGDPRSHEVQPEVAQALLAAAGVLEERVAAVDDDVPLLEERDEGVDGGVGRATGLDHENDAAGTFQGGDEIRQVVGGHEIPLEAVECDDLVGAGGRPIVEGHSESPVGEVAGQVRSHHRHSDHPDLGQLLVHVTP